MDQGIAIGIVANDGDRHDLGTQVGNVVGGVGSATRHELRFTMTKNEYGSFSRDAGYFTEFENVGDEVTQDDDGLRRKLLDILC